MNWIYMIKDTTFSASGTPYPCHDRLKVSFFGTIQVPALYTGNWHASNKKRRRCFGTLLISWHKKKK
jgi:hypothetical protein